jgi:signal transduction histidine kinase
VSGSTGLVSAPLPPARRLLAKLLLAMLGPTVIMVGVFGFWAHQESRLAVEDALGRRLGAAAAGAALLVLPEQLEAIAAGDEDTMTYARLRASLLRARETLDVRRVLFVARDLTGRGDSDGRIGLGAVAHELKLDAVELDRAARGGPVASPLFLGSDGRPYKRAYAAIRGQPPTSDQRGAVAGFAVVEASADTVAPLSRLRQTLIFTGALGLLLILLFGVVMARRLTGPLGRLAAAAERIGGGDLQAAVPIETRDEVGQLAARLDEMRLALRTRDERLQMMLAGIAHEVRNPLGGLQLYAGLLRESLAGDGARLADVGRIEREVRYLEQVVTDFLEYARRPHAETEPQPLRPLFEEVAEVVGAGAISVELADDLCVLVDRGQLRRALINLVRNAVSAAGGGKVVLAARPSAEAPGRALVEVRDAGPGVPPELRAKIFEPFFTTREKGTGLGLAFVREIVRDHGGDVAVDAAPEGGARFHFDLPLGSPRAFG